MINTKKLILTATAALLIAAFTGCDGLFMVADKIPDAENVFFTSSGRLFITGGEHIYELTVNGAVPIPSAGTGEFLGMAQIGSYLYVVHCPRSLKAIPPINLSEILSQGLVGALLSHLTDAYMNKLVLRAKLDTSDPAHLVFRQVHELKDMVLPNGMAADSSGRLYIADETILPCGKIVRLTIGNPDSDNPAVAQETWLNKYDGVYSPNGMTIKNDVLFFTDFELFSSKQAKVKKVQISGNGHGAEIPIYSATGLFDDLDTGRYKNTDGVAVANFLTGAILFIGENGGLVDKIPAGTFECPSSAHFGRGMGYDDKDLIVTEKGILFEGQSSFGNKVRGISVQ